MDKTPQAAIGWVKLRPWERGLRRVTHLPVVFHAIAFLDCSVPGTRGRLGWLLHPERSRVQWKPAWPQSESPPE